MKISCVHLFQLRLIPLRLPHEQNLSTPLFLSVFNYLTVKDKVAVALIFEVLSLKAI